MLADTHFKIRCGATVIKAVVFGLCWKRPLTWFKLWAEFFPKPLGMKPESLTLNLDAVNLLPIESTFWQSSTSLRSLRLLNIVGPMKQTLALSKLSHGGLSFNVPKNFNYILEFAEINQRHFEWGQLKYGDRTHLVQVICLFYKKQAPYSDLDILMCQQMPLNIVVCRMTAKAPTNILGILINSCPNLQLRTGFCSFDE